MVGAISRNGKRTLSGAIIDCKKVLPEIRDLIKLFWVPGQSNIIGNEKTSSRWFPDDC